MSGKYGICTESGFAWLAGTRGKSANVGADMVMAFVHSYNKKRPPLKSGSP